MERVNRVLASRSGRVVIAGVLGLWIVLALMGPGPLNPRNVAWIYGDNSMYYSAWAQYRHDTSLHWPITWTNRIGYPFGTSIALIDAMPLAAIVLRPFSPLLGDPFQFLGLYTLVSFGLQMWFGVALCRRLVPGHPVFTTVGGVFFLVAPPLTWRVFGHTPLLAHWPLLAALEAYFRDPGERPVRWLSRFWILTAIAAFLTPYVAVMCLLLTLTALGRLLLERRRTLGQTTLLAVASVAVLYASGHASGLLGGDGSVAYWAPGYGFFSLNLNSPVNPMTYGSILLPELPVFHAGQIEGFNYLGLGVLALIAAAVLGRPRAVLRLADRRLIPLAVLAILSTLVAASTTITLGSKTLLTIALPEKLDMAVQSLRASGRFFWTVHYLIVAAAVAVTFRAWRPPFRLAILIVACALQIADTAPLRHEVRRVVDQRFFLNLASPEWSDLGRRYENLIVLPAWQCSQANAPGGPNSYWTFSMLAAREHMRLNSFYGSRHGARELQTHCADLLRTQLEGTVDPASAYVVSDGIRGVWALRGVRSIGCRRVDKLNLCTPMDDGVAPAPDPVPPAAAYTLGETLDFSTREGVQQYMTFGWGLTESGATWTEGPLAIVRLGMDASQPARDLELEVAATPFVFPGHPRLDADIAVNGQVIDHWTYRMARRFYPRKLTIPVSVTAGHADLTVEFRLENPAAPLFLGAGPSTSFYGLHVSRFTVRPR